MSRAARAVVRLAALTLPLGVRARYREEWLGDIVGSREAGVAASGIAAGAVLFSVTLRRDSPDVLGMPLSAAARRHARWATALLLSAMVFAFGGYLTGGFSNGEGGALGGAIALWVALTAVGTTIGLAALWRAAMISSPLSKIAAGILTAAVLIFVSGVLTPVSSALGVLFVPVGLVFALVGTICGAIAWAGSTGATEVAPAAAVPDVPLPTVTSRRSPPALVVAVIIAAVLLAALILSLTGALVWLSAFIVPGFVLYFGVLFVVRARRTAHAAAPREAWFTVVLISTLALAAMVVGALDLFVWSPQAQAPGYTLDEIWDALSPADAAYGTGFAVTWIVFWTVAALAYLVGSIAVLGRAARPSTRSLASAGLLVVAGAVFFHFFAYFSIGMSIADTIPPYSGGGSAVRAWYAMAGQLALVAFLVLSIAPRPLSRSTAGVAGQASDATT